MMTNNHCIESASEAASAEVWFNYQQASCGGARAKTVKVQANQLLSTGRTLDYSLFNVKEFSKIREFGHLGLDPRIPNVSERIFIPQHPGGALKRSASKPTPTLGAFAKLIVRSLMAVGTEPMWVTYVIQKAVPQAPLYSRRKAIR